MSTVSQIIGEALFGAFAISYAIFTLVLALLYGLIQKETWFKPTSEQRDNLEKACHDLWSLSNPNPEVLHNFLTLSNGVQLHYLSAASAPDPVGSLIIFLHGFPDSSYIWRRQLQYKLASQAKLVALDLPGCGGSDSLEAYGPDAVLNAISEAITLLKRKHLAASSRGQCVLVAHDWGGAIAFRLASETSGLVDRMVIVNSVYPRGAREQIIFRLGRSRQFLHSGRLGDAYADLQAVLAQLRKSSYIFLLSIPLPLARWMPWLSAALVKLSHGIAQQHLTNVTLEDVAINLALSCGPGSLECASRTTDGHQYGPSVLRRARTTPHGDWDERTRLYREGLGVDDWKPNYPGMTHSGKLDAYPSGKFTCPVNIVFGLRDVALDPRIVLENIERYFVEEASDSNSSADLKRKRILRLPNCGHWSILEDEGVLAVEHLLEDLVA